MRSYNVRVNGKDFFVEIEEADSQAATIETANTVEKPAQPPKPVAKASKSGTKVISPFPGLILKLNVQSGATVKAGQKLLVLEAMKMEHDIVAKTDGVVQLQVKQGDTVAADAVLAIIN